MMRRALWFTVTLAAGCAGSSGPGGQPPPAGTVPLVAPATYIGRVPCADCPGIRLTVTLLPDSTFRVRQVYEDRKAVFYSLGRWSVEEHGTRLLLNGGAKREQRFQIDGADSLRMLDSVGRPIHSLLSYSLFRTVRVDPVRDTMRLRGTYTYMADAGRFTECLSGSRFPVAQVGANAALERAYGAARTTPGAPLLVVFRGHFEERPAMDGDRLLQQVVVDSVERVGPGAGCEEPMSRVTLEDTYWKLLDVAGQPARVADSIAEPQLLLHPAQKEAGGSTGCNSFRGAYQLSGDSLRFGPLITTRRACLNPETNQQERWFLNALGDTRTWQVAGDTLTLTGEAGQLARFAAQHTR